MRNDFPCRTHEAMLTHDVETEITHKSEYVPYPFYEALLLPLKHDS